jgi:hypothetical protein
MINVYEKYKALEYQDMPSLNPLSFILTKAELARNLTLAEWQWLEQHDLLDTIGVIKYQEDYRNELHRKVRAELIQLKRNRYVSVSVPVVPDIDSEFALVLYKINAQERLSNTEERFVGSGYHRFLDFNDRKQRNEILEDIPFDEKAESVLSKLERQIQFSADDIEWMYKRNYLSFLSALENQFSFLEYKYKADNQENSIVNDLLLCLILQKLDEKKILNDSEFHYLRENGFGEMVVIAQQIEFAALKQKYHATQIQEDSVNHHLYKILKKLEAGISLPESDFNYLKKQKLFATLKFVYSDFNDRKQRNGISDDIPSDQKAESILSKVEQKSPFTADDIEWIYKHNGISFLSSLKKQLPSLQHQYKAAVQEGSDINNLLLALILQKLHENKCLDESQVQYLRENGFDEAVTFAQQIEFSELKQKYQATQIQEDNINDHLCKVLKKLEAGKSLPEPDVNYLKKRKLFETLKFVYKKEIDSLVHKIGLGHGLRPDDIVWCEKNYFKDIIFLWLKKEYEVKYHKDTPESPLYTILIKLEASQRLTDEEVVWLQAEKLLKTRLKDSDYYVSTRIFIAHHTLEAKFYENEFERTKDFWKLASASSHWRKAERSEHALTLTANLNLKQIKPAKLRAALLTTRGGALRDVDRLKEAENCALEAIKHFPESHNPYTLMGALCYDRGEYGDGDKWFAEAVKRGAKFDGQDAEIKCIFRKKKGQERKELIEHLLKKDSDRFSWVKKF